MYFFTERHAKSTANHLSKIPAKYVLPTPIIKKVTIYFRIWFFFCQKKPTWCCTGPVPLKGYVITVYHKDENPDFGGSCLVGQNVSLVKINIRNELFSNYHTFLKIREIKISHFEKSILRFLFLGF